MLRVVFIFFIMTTTANSQTFGDRNELNCSALNEGDMVHSVIRVVCGIPPEQIVMMLELALSQEGDDYGTLIQMLERVWPDASIIEVQRLRRLLQELKENRVSEQLLVDAVAGIVDNQISQRSVEKPFDCSPLGGMSGDAVDRSIILHNQGSDYWRRGDTEKATVCFIGSVQQWAENVGSLNNLAEMKFVAGTQELGPSLYYLDWAVGITFSQIRAIDYGRIQHLLDFGGAAVPPCDVQRNMTGDRVDWSPFALLLQIFKRLGRTSQAMEAYQRAIDMYPNESCVYDEAIGSAAATAAKLSCGDSAVLEHTAEFIRIASSVGHYGGSSATGNQEFLKKKGYYDGPIDGAFGENSTNAFVAWATDGCPS